MPGSFHQPDTCIALELDVLTTSPRGESGGVPLAPVLVTLILQDRCSVASGSEGVTSSGCRVATAAQF